MLNDHIKSEISAYLAGGLPEIRNRQIEEHVAACEKCRQAMTKARGKQARVKREALKKASSDPLPNLFLARQGKELGADHSSPRWPWIFSGLILIGGATYWISRNSTSGWRIPKVPAIPSVPAEAPVVPPLSATRNPESARVAIKASTTVIPSTPEPVKSPIVLQPQQEWKGAECAIVDKRMVVIRNQKTWDKLWSEMAVGGALPPINFEEHVAVGVFAGESPAGATISLGQIRERQDEVVVPFRVTQPEVAVSTSSAPSHPYLVSLLPLVDKKIRLTQKEASP